MNAPASPLRRRLAAVAALLLVGLGVTRAADLADADRLVPLPATNGIARGMHRDEVVLRVGRPDETVLTTIWVYWNFHRKGRPPGDAGLDTLVVCFDKDRVSHLRLTERQPTIALLGEFRRQQAAAAAKAPAAQ